MIEPDWQSEDGSVRLYCADAKRLLSSLRNGIADTDIPYGEVNRESSGLRNLDKGIADDETFPLSFVVSEASRLASGSLYVWCGTEQVSQLRGGFVDAGMTTRLGIWEKTNPSPMNGDRLWLSSIECCVFARHPKAYFARHCKGPVWRGPVARNQEHPTQKPVWLMEELTDASARPTGTVLDFCMGSGTTGVACVNTGRKFIGIEIDRGYFDIAVKRISDAILARSEMLIPT